MGPMYDKLCAQFQWPVDEALRARLAAANSAALAAMDAVIADARVQHGDVEVGAAVLKKAQYLGAAGSVEAALKAYKELPEKALSTGGKADVAMACARLGIAHGDWACVRPARARPPLAGFARSSRHRALRARAPFSHTLTRLHTRTPPTPPHPPRPAAWPRRSWRRPRR